MRLPTRWRRHSPARRGEADSDFAALRHRERSVRHRLATPLVWALSLSLLFFLGGYFGRSLYDSILARIDLHESVHPDHSVVDLPVSPRVERRIAMLDITVDGQPRRVAVDAEDLSAFVRERLEVLDRRRNASHARADQALNSAVSPIFDDMDRRIERYADWYFSWLTTYRIMGVAAQSAVAYLAKPVSALSLRESVEVEVRGYISKHYTALVLRPELNDARLKEAFDGVVAELHGDFRDAMAQLDRGFQVFAARQGEWLEEPPASDMTLDWNGQFNKLGALAGYEKGDIGAAAGAVLVGSGAVVGAKIGAQALAAGGKGLIAKLASPFVAKGVSAAAAAGAGGAAGAIGGPLGAVIGAGIGLGVDAAVNEGVELIQRDQFVADTRDALQATRDAWIKRMRAALHQAIDVWYGDGEQLLARYGERR